MSEQDDLQKEADELKKELDQLKEQVKEREEKTPKKTSKKTSKTKYAQSISKKNQKKEKPQDAEALDPDRLALSKEQILEFCDEVLEKWGKEPVKNSKQIFAMNTVKTSIVWTDEDTLKQIWSEILKWSFELFFKNALAQAKEGDERWARTLEKIRKGQDS